MAINYVFQCKGSDPKGKNISRVVTRQSAYIFLVFFVFFFVFHCCSSFSLVHTRGFLYRDTEVRVVTQKKEYEPGSDPTKNENG
jgi:cell division protein FtsB